MNFPPILSKLVAVAIPITVLVLLFLLVVSPINSAKRKDHTKEMQLIGQIAAERNLIAAGPSIQAALARVKASEAPSDGTIAAKTDALAAAALQNALQHIVSHENGQIQSIEILAPSRTNGYEAISARLSFTIPVSSLANLIEDLETHNPYIFVETASLQTPVYLSDQNSGNAPQQLSGIFTVQSYRRAAQLQ